MASPLEPSQISFLVPLLLVIVERLATLTRSIADEPTDFTGTRPLLAPVSETTDTGTSSEDFHFVPRLGRLNILHLTNVSLLTAAVVLLAGTEPGLITNVLALLVAVIWLQLPLIEVDLYDDIRDQISWPLSLYVNIGGALAIMAFVGGFGGFEPGLFLQESNVFSPDMGLVLDNLDQVGASVLLLGLILGTSWGFLQLFEREVAQIDATDGDAAGTE